jgi:hypothetical protein
MRPTGPHGSGHFIAFGRRLAEKWCRLGQDEAVREFENLRIMDHDAFEGGDLSTGRVMLGGAVGSA